MSPYRILLTEDDPDHQQLFRLALTESSPGLVVHTASTGDEALQTLSAGPPGNFDCVVMDFNLPDRRADEVLRHLAQQPDHPPVIVVSSGKSQDIVIDSLRSGSVDFVPKEDALSGDFLWKRIQSAVAKARRASRERRKLARRAERLNRLTELDPLTGLCNRRAIDRLLNNHRPTLDRRGRVSVAMIDIDHFKRVNDSCGHEEGDRVLRLMADALRAQSVPGEVVARWGGEEFLVVRPATSLAGTVLWAESLRRKIERRTRGLKGLSEAVTASFGVINSPSVNLSPQTIAEADAAMYLAKHRGRNRVCTGEMVTFERLLDRAEGRSHGDAETCLHRFVELAVPLLGPAQRDRLTGHAERVRATSFRLAHCLSLGEAELGRLRFAALAHDLGDALVPEVILAKSGPLSCEEREFLSYHADYGAEMAERLGADRGAVELIRHHHTRFDALSPAARKEAPRGARILAAADAFVAMTSPRPYEPPRSVSAAVGEMQHCRGTQFDPVVVEVFPRAIRGHSS